MIFPLFSRSHYLVIAKVGEELAARGHGVSSIINFEMVESSFARM